MLIVYLACIFLTGQPFPLLPSLTIIPSTRSKCRCRDWIQHFFTNLAFGKLPTVSTALTTLRFNLLWQQSTQTQTDTLWSWRVSVSDKVRTRTPYKREAVGREAPGATCVTLLINFRSHRIVFSGSGNYSFKQDVFSGWCDLNWMKGINRYYKSLGKLGSKIDLGVIFRWGNELVKWGMTKIPNNLFLFWGGLRVLTRHEKQLGERKKGRERGEIIAFVWINHVP